ncbi:MAG: DMT family transporter [Muribaculaceae bacterium]|nr:DMT family transporter [Muribaculaceae bacterium]
MWIAFAAISALCLGFYDVFKKKALNGNNVFAVLFLNTVFCTVIMSPVLIGTVTDPTSNFVIPQNHILLFIKAVIVTTSWLLGYFAIKHLPLTIQGSVNAFRPVLVLVGAIIIFSERLNVLQWIGVILGFASLLWVGFVGRREGVVAGNRKWLLCGIASVVLWAASGLYDKFLMNHFKPINVEAWYSFYQFLIMSAVMVLSWKVVKKREPFKWRWSIFWISLFICAADLTYFLALYQTDSMVSVASMLRRSSALVAFFYGIFVLREKNVKFKIVDQLLMIAGVTFLIIGSL